MQLHTILIAGLLLLLLFTYSHIAVFLFFYLSMIGVLLPPLISSCLTLRVDVWILVSSSVYAEQRLRADAAKIHTVDIQHHAGDYCLVKQRRTGYLEKRPQKSLSRLFCDAKVEYNLCNLFCCSVNIPVPDVGTMSVSSGRKQSGVL